MKKLSLVGIVGAFLVIGFNGCADKFEYQPPKQTEKVKKSVTLNISKDQVWKKIIPKLGNTFFVVNNIDKESGFINVSYSGNPEKYIDCGNIYSYVKNARGERSYNFPASKAYQQYETMENGNNYQSLIRKMNLDGRINIIVQDIEAEKTLLTVNTKYIVKKDITVKYHDGYNWRNNYLTDTISFNTNGSETYGDGGTTCYATGTLENELLDLLK